MLKQVPLPMTKIALGIEYDGSHYYGWQRQYEVKSIQACLELALSKVANEPTKVYCAGRTDAGVHATNQVIHFETSVTRKNSEWTMGVNSHLPIDIAIRWSKVVESDFHARFSATARRYRYLIFNNRYRPAILSKGITHYHAPLDTHRMHIAAQALLGEQDFTSFRAIQCQSQSTWRNIKHARVNRYGDYIVIDIKANAFAHHMVRNIVGSLLAIGRGDQDIKWIAQLLALKDRTKAAPTARPEGLYLVAVDYPLKYKLPHTTIGPLFLLED
ncbi:MAG: tRNA pseudouridine(38-40) synthase TruA [Candidatus Arsenophonus melophagi]|nr:tRNA pseudouridine(38-40) synthase TruA [Candidatus Arsenophonus melophagi]